MNIKIDYKKISSSTFNNSELFTYSDQEMISQFEYQLIYGNPSCFLVTGYRGSGKTSLIHQVEKKLKDQTNILFIYMNFSKYEKYTLILRKLIRQIYLAFSNHQQYKALKNSDPEIIGQLELLYKRTFNDVNHAYNDKAINEFETKLQIDSNFKKLLISIACIIFAGFNSTFNLLPTHLNSLLLLFSALWAAIEAIKLTFKFTKRTTKTNEMNIKSLYDDEIAEYHIINILKVIKKHKINIVFVFDELDKIENEDEIEQSISELKPLLLSNLANFIIVSGQKLYYKFTDSNTVDDSVLSSLFTKQIHVRLLSNNDFRTIFSNIVINKDVLSQKLATAYLDSLILNSNRVLRKFINLISQDIVWENSEGKILINEEDEEILITDSKLLNIITSIIEKHIESLELSEGIKDFFISQIYKWVQKMKLYNKIYFSKEDIYNLEKDYIEKSYPYWCITQLDQIFAFLAEELKKDNLLDEMEKNIDGEKVIQYKWSENANIKTDVNVKDLNQIKSKFVLDMIEFEKALRNAYNDLTSNHLSQNKKPNSLRSLIQALIQIGMLTNWPSNQINEFINLNNRLRHGEEISEEDTKKVDKFTFKLPIYLYQLYEDYTFYVTKKYLEQYNFYVSKPIESKIRVNNYDFIARNSIEGNADILFEVIHKNSISKKDITLVHKSVQLLKEYNIETNKRNKMVIFFYSKNGRKSFENYSEFYNEFLSNESSDLNEEVSLFYASEYRSDFSTGRLETYLKQVIEK
ncbi:ATP-binding protein [Paenibacillus sp. Dod16]|uniref:ATP-binding protein n=1 Tax=Paenibacillus sp. Dod16 TaxID=3416392 RepID=UPI003CF8682E